MNSGALVLIYILHKNKNVSNFVKIAYISMGFI